MFNSIDGVMAQAGGLSTFANGDMAFKMFLAQPDCKAAFAEHLSEAQLQDYLDFIEARLQRNQQAVARRIATALDRELSLTANQREKVVKLLRSAVWNSLFPTAMNILQISSQEAVHLAPDRLRISLDGILSDAQSKVWQGLLVEANWPKKLHVVIHANPDEADEILVQADANKKRPFIRRKPVKHVEIKKEANIVINEINVRQKQPWIDVREKQRWNEINADTAESQKQMIQLTEAKLAAHTELLGPLTERAARRLALVAKGVAQQYTEAQDKTHDAMDELWRDRSTKVGITDHPMYQRTIKDVLSEAAFAQYSTYQAEREVWYQQVLRNLVVACMDTQLLLGPHTAESVRNGSIAIDPRSD